MAKKSGPLSFLSKKGFHPSTFRNSKRVFEAERDAEARRRSEVERQLAVRAERREEEQAAATGSKARRGGVGFLYEMPKEPDRRKRSRSAGTDEPPSKLAAACADVEDPATEAFMRRWEGQADDEDEERVSATPASFTAQPDPTAPAHALDTSLHTAPPRMVVDAVRLREDPMLSLPAPSADVVPMGEQPQRRRRAGERSAPGVEEDREAALAWRGAVDKARAVAAAMGVGAVGLREARRRAVPAARHLRLRPAAAAAVGVSSAPLVRRESDDSALLRRARAAAAAGPEAESRLLAELGATGRERLLELLERAEGTRGRGEG